jgi:glucokinase
LTNDAFNFDTLFRAKDEGDTVAREVLQHCVEVWSALKVSLIHAYGPELILFGGAVMRRGEEVLEPIRGFAGHAYMESDSRSSPN